MRTSSLAALLISATALLSAQSAIAHSVQTDYLLSPESELSLDVTYSTGDPVSETMVKVYSPDNPDEPWMEGKTDENGQFKFLPDNGKEGEWTVKIGEYDHGDILMVPVDQNGVDLDKISENTRSFSVATHPFKVNSQPAQAFNVDTPTADSAPGVQPFFFLTLTAFTGLGLWSWKRLRR